MRIRQERPNDVERITRIQYAAFKGHPMHEPGAEPVEHRIVERLRAANALSLSLLAEEEQQLVGHIALSPATVGGTEGWRLLGPIGVLPEHQGKGIGSALLREALRRMRAKKLLGVVLVGDPGFYGRFGFCSAPGLSWEGVPEQFVLALPFSEVQPEGAIIAHEAFSAA